MAQKVTVVLEDDLTGQADDTVTTVEFGLDGVQYTIDLNEENAERLRVDVLGEVIEHARRTGGRIKRGFGPSSRAPRLAAPNTGPITNGSVGRGREQIQAIRDWARSQGYSVSDRGRVSAAITEAFDAAHAAPAPAARGRRRA